MLKKWLKNFFLGQREELVKFTVLKEFKGRLGYICKDCRHFTKFHTCDYTIHHDVIDQVFGEKITHPLLPLESRMAEILCGARARWFKPKEEDNE